MHRDVFPREWTEPDSNGLTITVRCTGHSENVDLLKPTLYLGSLGTTSLVHDGVTLGLQQLPFERGIWQEEIGSETCTRSVPPFGTRQAYSYDVVQPGSLFAGERNAQKTMWGTYYTPDAMNELVEVPSARGLLGRAFDVHREYEETTPSGAKAKVVLTLALEPCPRGGRAVKGC